MLIVFVLNPEHAQGIDKVGNGYHLLCFGQRRKELDP